MGHTYHQFPATSLVKTDIPRIKRWNVISLIKSKDCWACRDYILLRLTEINVVLPNIWSVRHDSSVQSASMSTNTRDPISKTKEAGFAHAKDTSQNLITN